jgi:hypothetical protein
MLKILTSIGHTIYKRVVGLPIQKVGVEGYRGEPGINKESEGKKNKGFINLISE